MKIDSVGLKKLIDKIETRNLLKSNGKFDLPFQSVLQFLTHFLVSKNYWKDK